MASVFVSAVPDSKTRNFERHKLFPVDLKNRISHLREKVSEVLKRKYSDFELVFLGKHLNNEDETIEACGIKNGMTVFVYPKYPGEQNPAPSEKLDRAKIQQLVVAFRTAIVNPSFRSMVQRLSKPEVLESILAATPGLVNDPVAIGILQDPELLLLLADPIHIQNLVEKHPALAEAAIQIAAAFHEEVISSGPSSQSVPEAPISYSLDALSDDDDMDMGADLDPSFADPSLLSPNRITPAQLASALAAVAAAAPGSEGSSLGGSQLPPVPPSPQLSAPPPTPRNPITSAMFNEAIQSALGTVVGPNLQVPDVTVQLDSSADSNMSAELNNSAGEQQWQSQLQQLRDMGIQNDAASIRALTMTGGDVQAALELIFADLSENDDLSS